MVLAENKDGLVFYERNGETRNFFQVKWSETTETSTRHIQGLAWNCDGSLLAMQVKNDEATFLEVWWMSNYELTKKWSWMVPSDEGRVLWSWHDSNETRLIILTASTGQHYTVELSPYVDFSRNLSLNVVVASGELRLTNLCKRAIPPPFSERTLKLDGEVACLGFSEDSIDVVTSKQQLVSYVGNNEKDIPSFEEKIRIQLPGNQADIICGVVQLKGVFYIWCHRQGIDRILSFDPNTEKFKMYEDVDKNEIGWIGVNPSTDSVEFATRNGKIFELDEDFNPKSVASIGSFSSISIDYLEKRRVTLADNCLLVDEHNLERNVTSAIVRNSEVLYTDMKNKLRFLGFENTNFKGDHESRELEMGSELVACSPDMTNVVVQTPRGNIETIHPRRFVLEVVRKMLDAREYRPALILMKKHRVPLSFAMEHCPHKLVEDVPLIVREVEDPQVLEQLIISCTEEGNPKEKIEYSNRLCAAFVKEIQEIETEKRLKLFSVFGGRIFLRSSAPDIGQALLQIKSQRDSLGNEKDRDFFTRSSLHHLTFFVPAKSLFNSALATYDLHLAQQVAEASNQDPKEFLPLLNELNKISDQLEKRYRIDCVREDWKCAVRDLLELDAKSDDDVWWQKAQALVEEHSLHVFAISSSERTSPRYSNLCEIYANKLEKKAAWAQAATFYELSGNQEQSLRCLTMDRNFEAYLQAAKRFGVDPAEMKPQLERMAEALRLAHKHLDRSLALREIGKPCVEVVEAFCDGQHWLKARNSIGVPLVSTSSAPEIDRLTTRARDRREAMENEIERRKTEFERHFERLNVVRENKKSNIERIGVDDPFEILDDNASQVTSSTTRSTTSSRLSVASTVRRQKQIEKKKNSLKEGGEYEDSALLIALAAHYKWYSSVLVVEKEPTDLAEAAKNLGGRFTSLFKRSPAHLDYPTSEIYEGSLQDTNRANELEGEALTHQVQVYHSGRSDEVQPKIVEAVEKEPTDLAEAAKNLGGRFTSLFKRSPAHLDYPVSEIYEGPLQDTNRANELEGEALTQQVQVYHSGRSDEVQPKIVEAVEKEPTDMAEAAKNLGGRFTSLFKRSPAHLDYPVSEIYEGPLQDTNRANELEGEALTQQVQVYHSGRSDEVQPKIVEAVEKEPTDLAEAAKNLGGRFTSLFKRSPAHLDYPVSEIYEGPLQDTNRANELEGETLTQQVQVYHSGRSDEVQPKIVEVVEKEPTDLAEAAKNLGGRFTSLFKRSPAHLDYPTSEFYEGPLQDTNRANELEGEALTHQVQVYHSGRSDEVQPKIVEVVEKEPTDLAEAAKNLGGRFTSLFKRSPAHLDYPTSEIYEGPLQDTNRANELEGEALTHQVQVYHSGRSDEAQPKIVEVVEKEPTDLAEAAKNLGGRFTSLFKRSPAHLDYPVSEIYEGPLQDTNRANELEGEALTHQVQVYHSGEFLLLSSKIAYTDGFIYLGTHLHFADASKTEIQRRIRSAWSVFHKFKTHLTRRNVSNVHKAKIYNMCIELAFLYGSETWTLKKKERDLLATAQRKMMRWMLGVTLLDRRRNSWLYERLKLREVRSEAVKRKWLFAKKIATGEDTWAKKIVEWRPWAKNREVGRSKPRWQDDLRAVLDEATQLVQVLVALTFVEEASRLQEQFESFAKLLSHHKSAIWPTTLSPWMLPGPFHALYTAEQIVHGTPSRMPAVIKLGMLILKSANS
ncbi:unnamed protein product [Caenorhabditis auriculariae]|uniref:Uncharacterized protein n=1 Tax=Caenorhabditis auriculariae TaxID=2777116 RepID=A0A8S1GNM7_9PELO|nr:unnamed protein product [Caenorhabditis auriculariae]